MRFCICFLFSTVFLFLLAFNCGNSGNSDPPIEKTDADVSQDSDTAFIPNSQCTEEDHAYVAQELQELISIIEDCIMECVTTNPDVSGCFAECLVNDSELSTECVDCYVDMIMCTFKNCMMECAGNPVPPECGPCREQYCDEDFVTCSGLVYSSP